MALGAQVAFQEEVTRTGSHTFVALQVKGGSVIAGEAVSGRAAASEAVAVASVTHPGQRVVDVQVGGLAVVYAFVIEQVEVGHARETACRCSPRAGLAGGNARVAL